METRLFKTGLLSVATASLLTSTLVTTNLFADRNITSVSLDLETYSKIRIEFNETAPSDTSLDKNFTIRNTTTDDNLTLTFDFNDTNYAYYTISGGKESGTGNDLNATEAVKKIRGNTQNNLYLAIDENFSNDVSSDFNKSLLKTLGTLAVTDNAWNLVTMPAGVYTNAKEMIKANKATMIWGWDLNSSNQYNWVPYPDRMEPGRGYWVRTRISNNTGGSLGNVVASDYNVTLLSDYNSSIEVNASNFAQVVSFIPQKEEWVLLGNSGANATIVDTRGSENNSTTYFFEDLLNGPEECYFVSIYHWDAANGKWVNDTENGQGTVPANAGVWVKQRLCNQ